MANDISGINSSRTQQSGDRGLGNVKKDTKDSASSSMTSSGSASGADKVSLTDTAERLQALEQQLAQQPEINKGKVDEVQNAMSSGSYKVNPERVADKMLAFESAFQK
ncbi:MAG: flagellar biosynthesis anti-sigma factor FlgM [Gammaproteobacteria bacterium]|nr:flagellar biosynthesis anti-sigma factor FlgM [Gammaproteobacteria bacterium]MDH5776577.1 flagellar biosynthesis anti-sigma factor FlgM [Gammaproteobacteria bacterium]